MCCSAALYLAAAYEAAQADMALTSAVVAEKGLSGVTTVFDRTRDARAAPGVVQYDVAAVNRAADRALYATAPEDLSEARARPVRTVKWLVMAVTLGIYYALPWLRWNRGPDLPDQAVLLDMANNRFFVVLPRDLAAGVLLRHWPSRARCARPVSRDIDRGTRVVRLHLSADGVDGSHDHRRALLAGRSQCAHPPRQGAVGRRQDLQEDHDASVLDARRAAHRRRLRVLFSRCADACR